MANNTIRQAEIRVITPDMSRGTLNALSLNGMFREWEENL